MPLVLKRLQDRSYNSPKWLAPEMGVGMSVEGLSNYTEWVLTPKLVPVVSRFLELSYLGSRLPELRSADEQTTNLSVRLVQESDATFVSLVAKPKANSRLAAHRERQSHPAKSSLPLQLARGI